MSLAPLHGRPAPLVFDLDRKIQWPRIRPAALRKARLSTRARRERNRRRTRILIATAAVTMGITAAFWLMLTLRG